MPPWTRAAGKPVALLGYWFACFGWVNGLAYAWVSGEDLRGGKAYAGIPLKEDGAVDGLGMVALLELLFSRGMWDEKERLPSSPATCCNEQPWRWFVGVNEAGGKPMYTY